MGILQTWSKPRQISFCRSPPKTISPGPSVNFAEQDLGFSNKRSNGRHYLAFLEAVEARRLDAFPYRRLRRVLDTEAAPGKTAIRRVCGRQRNLFLETTMTLGRYLLATVIGLSLIPSAGVY